MMIDYIGMLQDFHAKFAHYAQCQPNAQVRPAVKNLRIMLMEEELRETIEAINDDNLIEIADGLADLLYVVFGTALAYGIPIDEVFLEVHRSNMSKSMLKDENSIPGKTLKGPNWTPPDIKSIIERHLLVRNINGLK